MRYVYIAVAMVFIFSAAVYAVDSDQKNDTSAKQAGSADVKSQEKEIVVDSNERASNGKEFGVGKENEMPSGETYDQNTGLPNVVESDKEGEIEQ